MWNNYKKLNLALFCTIFFLFFSPPSFTDDDKDEMDRLVKEVGSGAFKNFDEVREYTKIMIRDVLDGDVNLDNLLKELGILGMAVAANLPEEVEKLLNLGADPNQRNENNDGLTSLELAIVKNYLEVADKLITSPKTDLNLANKNGVTPIILASLGNRSEMVDKLRANPKTDLNKIDSRGRTALHYACLDGKIQIVNSLLADKRTKPDLQEGIVDGVTALMAAAFGGQAETMRLLLLDGGVDSSKKDNAGHTVRDYIDTKKCQRCLDVLSIYGGGGEKSSSTSRKLPRRKL